MTGFARTFLNEDWKARPHAPRLYLCAFGKHPGWNDHLDDIGVSTDSLIQARRSLYGGIASQIESAAWNKAGPEKVAPDFNHVVHWSRLGESISGLIWSSQDGKGRALYPMIALAHCVGQPVEWVDATVLPALEQLAVHCRGTASADEVISLVRRTEESLRVRLPADAGGADPVSKPGVATWAAHYSHEPEGLRRVLHFIHAQLGSFAPGSTAWGEGAGGTTSCSVRLPRIPRTSPIESLHAWQAFFATQIDPAVPLLGVVAREGAWLDLIIGEPSPADFFVLRALPAALPPVTDVPYQLNLAWQAGWLGLFDDLGVGQLPSRSCFHGEDANTSREQAVRWLMANRPSEKPGFFGRLFRSTGA